MASYLPVIGSLVEGAFDWFGNKAISNAQKKAGTVLADAAANEAATALSIPGIVNPMIGPAYDRAQEQVGGAYGTSVDQIQQQAAAAAQGATTAANAANTRLDPYAAAGSGALTTLSSIASQTPEQIAAAKFDPTNLTIDPGYAFRLQQGQQALQKSALARGGLLGGGTLKSLTNYAQGLASTEYQNAYNRALSTFGANQDAQRQAWLENYQNRGQQMGALGTLSQLGYGAAGQAGQNTIQAAEYGGNAGMAGANIAGNWRNRGAETVANYGIENTRTQVGNILNAQDIARQARMGGAQATAGSILGSAGAISNGLSGLGGGIGGGITLAGMMYNNNRKPKANSGGGYWDQYGT